MTREQAGARLEQGVQADLAAAAAIRTLLERQFECALRHRGAELAELAARLEPELAAMEERRQQRVALVRALHGPEGSMAAFIAGVAEPARARLAAGWDELERLVLQCQHATRRNASLLADQHSVMQRVLHGEDGIYAPR